MARTVLLITALAGIAAISYVVLTSGEPTAPPAPAPVATESPVEQRRQQVQSVSQLYRETCANCHGENGQGGGAGTRTLLTRELFDQNLDRRFFDSIKNGVVGGGMEAYGPTMSDSQIWGLVVHIREMQARALRAEFGSPTPVNGVYKSQRESFRIETVVEREAGLATPWSIDWLPDGRALVTNRPGQLVIVKDGKIAATVEGTPAVRNMGQGGLLEVAVHPQYTQNKWIYLAYSDPHQDSQLGMTKLVRGKLAFEGSIARWTSQQTIFEVPKDMYSGGGVHFGCRIVFDGKGHLFFCIGERGIGELSQNLARPNGKVYRVMEDGKIPADNPFASAADREKGHLPAIWSYGHRNPQGLAFDLKGSLYVTEHAPRGGDELNRIVKGENYGWPLVSFGINYNDSPLATPWPTPEQNIRMPLFRWLPSSAACGLDTVRGDKFPNWKGDLIAGGLAGQNVDRVRVDGDRFIEREELLHGLGRVRDVACGPDGFVYVVLNQPDIIVRLVPAK